MRTGNTVIITALGVAVSVDKLLLWITECLISEFELLKVQVLFTHLPCR